MKWREKLGGRKHSEVVGEAPPLETVGIFVFLSRRGCTVAASTACQSVDDEEQTKGATERSREVAVDVCNCMPMHLSPWRAAWMVKCELVEGGPTPMIIELTPRPPFGRSKFP